MKTKLLFLSLLVLCISSCSVDENEGSALNETRLVLKKTMEGFYKMGKTTNFQDFMEDLNAKSLSGEYTQAETEQTFEDFLAEHDPALVELYYILVELLETGVLTENELVSLATELKEEIVGRSDQGKDNDCVGPGQSGWLGNLIIIILFCDSDQGTSDDSTATTTTTTNNGSNGQGAN